MDSTAFHDCKIPEVASMFVIVAGFIYCVHLSVRVIPRSIRVRWYRICLGALALSMWAIATFVLLVVFEYKALEGHHTKIAGIIGKIAMITAYCFAFSLVVSLWGLLGGAIKSKRQVDQR
jgi:hypothetical protein